MQGSQVPVNVLFNNNKLNLKVCYITIRLFQGAVGPMWKRRISCSNVVPSWRDCETEDFAYKFIEVYKKIQQWIFVNKEQYTVSD